MRRWRRAPPDTCDTVLGKDAALRLPPVLPRRAPCLTAGSETFGELSTSTPRLSSELLGTLAHPPPFGYHSPAMQPTNPATSPLRYPLAPNSQTACYSPWLKVRVLIRVALTTPWSGQEWAEVKQHLPWLLAEEYRLRRQRWLN